MNETLKEGGRTGTSGAGHARLRSGLVIAEIAVALILLAASGLLLRSFEKMREADLGYRPDHTVVAAYSLPRKQYATQAAVDQFNQELLRRVQAICRASPAPASRPSCPRMDRRATRPSLRKATLRAKPGADRSGNAASGSGRPFPRHGHFACSAAACFTEADDNPKGQLVAVVNQRIRAAVLARAESHRQADADRHPEMQTPWATVVGEVSSMKEGSPDADPRQQYYTTIDQAETFYRLAWAIRLPT